MANISITASGVAPVEVYEQFTGPAAESISAGQIVRQDETTGKLSLADASSASAAGQKRGMALISAAPNITVTALKRGKVDVGNALSSLDFDAPVYLSDTPGTLADTTGTVTVFAGAVTAGWASTTPDRLLWIDFS